MASLLWKWQITLGPLYFLGSALQTAWSQIELKEQNSALSAESPARAGICCSACQADTHVCGHFARLASELLFSLYLRLCSCIICSCTFRCSFIGNYLAWLLNFPWLNRHIWWSSKLHCLWFMPIYFFQSNIFTGDTMLCTVTNNTHNRIVTASPLSGEFTSQGHLENGADSVSRSRKHRKCKCPFHPSLGCLCFVPIFSPIMFISLCVGVYTSAPFWMPAHTHASFHVWLAVSSPSALLCVFRSLPSLN